MHRRELLGGLGAAGLAAMTAAARAQGPAFAAARAPLVPLLATPDRLFRVTVCLRPFRAAGPRIETEEVGRKAVVHHYGHGGSGWSLSWGSAMEAVPLALQTGERRIAVIGAGAIGLTTALTAQRMGADVTIYARERFPFVRSARATGGWTPDSRIAFERGAAPAFAATWERMARRSWAMYNGMLGLAGDPVEWVDSYGLHQPAITPETPTPHADAFLGLTDRLADIMPPSVPLPPGSHPFGTTPVTHSSTMTFNVAALAHQLETDFLAAGGRFVAREFHEPADVGGLKEKVVINCTGYGARALWRDASVVPVRGQIAWLIPQPGLTYALYGRRLGIRGRRDGIVVQPFGDDDFFGFNDANEEPDMAAAVAAVETAASLYRAG